MSKTPLKDCQAWKDIGLSLSTSNNEAAKLFDDVITQYVTWTESPDGGIEGTITRLLETDPNFVMGQVLSSGLELMATGRSVLLDKEFAEQIKKLEESVGDGNLSTREKMHCQSVLQFSKGEYYNATDIWEDILKSHPNDVLALKFAHDSYFYLGDSVRMRDSVDRVLPLWKPTDPLYGYLKGMLAFGLEESNQFTEAEKHSTEALSLNPTDCWATHAKAHCLEMTGRFNEGIQFMSSTEQDWSRGAMLACHNYWHWALYHIEKGDYEPALAIYDHQVEQRSHSSGAMLDLVDAASLLTRFELQGINVGSRWEKVYDLCTPHINDHLTVFNDFHMMMPFLACKQSREDVVEKYMSSLTEYCKNYSSFSRDLFNDLCIDLCNGLIAFREERFDDSAKLWYPIKDNVVRMGGSNAQRDVFAQLLANACIDSPKDEHQVLAKALLSERKKRKENSPLTDRLIKKLLSKHQ